MIGQILGSRYEISNVLATGGMSRTYLARDIQRPGHPTCVVKHLQPPSTQPDQIETARRLFNTEAEVLQQLGHHDCIPQLLAYFEQDEEFYLVQEFIQGTLLHDSLKSAAPWSETQVTQLLREVLQLLSFVHTRGAIHRDIKPGNLIQRPDGTWVLLDFGAVKQVRQSQIHPDREVSQTVAVGTPGYLAPESYFGKPRFSSDLYSLGIIGISALTGRSPDGIQDSASGHLTWHQYCPQVSDRFKAFLDRMVQPNFALRYPTAEQALQELESLTDELPEAHSIPPTIAANIPATIHLTQFQSPPPP